MIYCNTKTRTSAPTGRILMLNAITFWLITASLSSSMRCSALASAPRDTSSSSSSSSPTWKPRQPSQNTLVVGYSHNPSGGKVLDAINSGVNAVCWAFLHLDVDESSGEPMIRTDLDLAAIGTVRNEPGHESVVHMAAIGGWNAPHPPPGFSGERWAETFVEFNQRNGYIFDGIDWDLEGNDDREAPTSSFTIETLDVMADMSKTLKDKYGYIVSMAPAESYLDVLATDRKFSLDLNLFPTHWAKPDRHIVKDHNFAHAGRQCYAYVIHRAGIDTFDWVSIQLYESFSRFVYESTIVAERDGDDTPTAQMDALRRRAVAAFDGVDIELPNYGRVKVHVPPWKLVWGFANGWADGTKVVRVDRRTLNRLFVRLKTRGVMFWTIEEEGSSGAGEEDLYLARVISEALERSELDWHDLNDDILPPEEEDAGNTDHDEL
mmetsp:Transcript_1067/g.2307  ORF Transcript_1067/g.2307 Transcript_1067/m.2307 type:complete len:435 (-) Transcript_1067:84-1388(-)